MLVDPESLNRFAAQSPQMQPLVPIIEEMAAFTRAALGENRLAWLRALPRAHRTETIAVVHASPATAWRSPMPESSDASFESVYAELSAPTVVYGHTHRSFIRRVKEMTVINTGSVSLSYDGDPRAAYLLMDDATPAIRRVEYDVEREVGALEQSSLPHAAWIVKTLKAASPRMP